MPGTPVTVKGSPIRSLLKFIEVELTAAQREEMFSRLPAEDAARQNAELRIGN